MGISSKNIITCKNCSSPLNLIIADLGYAPPSNSFLKDLESTEYYYPLKVYLCESCLLAQCTEYKRADEIFSSEYVYFSSYSSFWLNHAREYVDMISSKLKLDSSSFVIEIASNDGYLLQFLKAKKIPNIGIEPTSSTANAAIKKGIEVIIDFFSSKLAQTLPKADLIIGNNVIAHVPNIRDFVSGVRIALKDSGVANFEFPHILNILINNQFDSIYHEHFYYYSLHSITNLFKNEGLYIYDVDLLNTHGGSLRIYASKRKQKISDNVKNILALEKSYNLDSTLGYLSLQDDMLKLKLDFLSLLLRLKKRGESIIGFGASAKGNTLLNYCGIKSDLISYVIDSSPYKQNLFLPGSHIKVCDKGIIKTLKPKYIWISAYNLKNEIIAEVKEQVSKNATTNATMGGGSMLLYPNLPKTKDNKKSVLSPKILSILDSSVESKIKSSSLDNAKALDSNKLLEVA